MDIKIENELVFSIEVKDLDKKQKTRQKRVVKIATENLAKMVIDRLDGKTGEC